MNYDFKVIIEDFSDFFFIPKAPDVTFNSDKVNELLLEDADFMKLMDVWHLKSILETGWS